MDLTHINTKFIIYFYYILLTKQKKQKKNKQQNKEARLYLEQVYITLLS